MKIVLYCITFILFTSNLFPSDYCNSLLCSLFNTSAPQPTRTPLTGYVFHRICTPSFDETNCCDQACAFANGCTWTAYGLNCIELEVSCCLSASLIAFHNAQKATPALRAQLANSLFAAPYNDKTK